MIQVIKKKGINPVTKEVLHWIQWTRVSTVAETSLAKKMARGGSYSVGEASGVMLDFPQYIIDELLNGNAVRVSGLGEFKLKVTGKADADPEKVTVRGAKASVTFEADSELVSRLQNESEFRIVAAPTAEGQKDAEGDDVPNGTDAPADNGETGGGGTDTPANGGDTPDSGGGNNPGGGGNGLD